MEESFPAANETCILIKEFLKSNSKVQIGRKDHSVSKENSKITTLDEITKIIDADINNNGNYALLELSVEKARKMKLGTRKILTPLKQFGMDDQGKDSTKKEGIASMKFNYSFNKYIQTLASYAQGKQKKILVIFHTIRI